MTTPKHAARMLNDLNTWAPLLTDTTASLISPRDTTTPTHTSGHRDLADLIAPTLDAPDQGAPALRTHAQITEWATIWCKVADLHNYTGSPLTALANNTTRLSETWDDWDAFTQDLHTLHTRTATLTGHAPTTIATCPRCGGNITTNPRKTGIPEHGACDTCDTWYKNHQHIAAVTIAYRPEITRRSNTYVPLSAVLEAWPQLTPTQLRQWAHRGYVRHKKTSYHTGDIRKQLQEKPNKTCYCHTQ